MKAALIIVLSCVVIFLSGCASGISRSGYSKPSGPPPSDIASRKIVIQCNARYNQNDVVVLGSIHAYDTGFSTRCDEPYILGIFCEEGRILGADVVNITEEKQPSIWWSSCYQAKAQFLRFKDPEMAKGLVSDAKYAPDLVAARAGEAKEEEKKQLEAIRFANSVVNSEQYGFFGGATWSSPRELTPSEAHAVETGAILGGMVGGLIAYSVTENHSPVKELKKRALKGDVAAQRSLGVDYERGYDVNQDYEEATKWYQLAADGGDAIAQNNLGSFYQYGLGNPTNYSKAVTLYQQSAAQGFPLAQSNLGYMYDFGLGVSTDQVAAVTWYRRAAEKNYSGGMYNLGMCYAQGNGVDRDLPQSYKWLSAAGVIAQIEQNGSVEQRVSIELDALKPQMTANQIADGEKLFKEWNDNYSKTGQ
ncbi:MAG TPA: tetratricopeptide repeat protein [Pseudomonadales bacterium]|nr:tetratricopeptide repeat protein [Pseudomonadales bacterium]